MLGAKIIVTAVCHRFAFGETEHAASFFLWGRHFNENWSRSTAHSWVALKTYTSALREPPLLCGGWFQTSVTNGYTRSCVLKFDEVLKNHLYSEVNSEDFFSMKTSSILIIMTDKIKVNGLYMVYNGWWRFVNCNQLAAEEQTRLGTRCMCPWQDTDILSFYRSCAH